MKRFITQIDEECSECGKELPKGSRCYVEEEDDYILCRDCYEDCLSEEEEN
jgi:hypothetical protein